MGGHPQKAAHQRDDVTWHQRHVLRRGALVRGLLPLRAREAAADLPTTTGVTVAPSSRRPYPSLGWVVGARRPWSAHWRCSSRSPRSEHRFPSTTRTAECPRTPGGGDAPLASGGGCHCRCLNAPAGCFGDGVRIDRRNPRSPPPDRRSGIGRQLCCWEHVPGSAAGLGRSLKAFEDVPRGPARCEEGLCEHAADPSVVAWRDWSRTETVRDWAHGSIAQACHVCRVLLQWTCGAARRSRASRGRADGYGARWWIRSRRSGTRLSKVVRSRIRCSVTVTSGSS